ncbi:MAG: glycosyltransferase family 2 protein [Planctomycetes bacterium]|nr:glycosyltransferase family 2 protein [Planctomycetota bacterium]
MLIVHYRDPRSLAACLRSLQRCAPRVEVLVVDNDSGEPDAAEAERAVRAQEGARWIPSGRNGGFGAGCNAGFEHLLRELRSLEFVLLLNPDAELEPGCLQALVAEADAHPEAGAIGGRLLDESGARVLFENGRARPWTLSRLHAPAPVGVTSFETEFVTGALLLLRIELLRAGLRFDERYFLYVEDLDLCTAIRAQGRTLRVTLDARARHVGGASHASAPPILGGLRERQLYEMTRSKVLYARKWLPWYQRWSFYALAVIVKPLLGLALERRAKFLRSYFKGFRAGLASRA